MSMSKTGSERGRKSKSKEKEDNRAKNSRDNALKGRGPVGLVIIKLIDMIILTVKKIFYLSWYQLSLPIFNTIYNVLFSEYKGIFAGKEKDGDCYNSSVFRYIITILVPPVGIFLSKGLAGWPSIFISVILTFYHMFPGIIYALVVTYNSRYADRYQLRELQRIEQRRLEKGSSQSKYSFTTLMVSVGLLFGILYLLMNFAKMVSNYKN